MPATTAVCARSTSASCTATLALPACLITVTAKTSKELILALKLTSFTALGFGLLLGAAFAL